MRNVEKKNLTHILLIKFWEKTKYKTRLHVIGIRSKLCLK